MAPALWALCSASALGDGGPAQLREALCLPSRRSLPSLPQWWAEVASFLHGVCGRDWALLILARRFPFARGRRYRRCADKCLRCADVCSCLPSPCLQKSDSRVAPPLAFEINLSICWILFVQISARMNFSSPIQQSDTAIVPAVLAQTHNASCPNCGPGQSSHLQLYGQSHGHKRFPKLLPDQIVISLDREGQANLQGLGILRNGNCQSIF